MEHVHKVAILGNGFGGRLHREVIEANQFGLEVIALADPNSRTFSSVDCSGYEIFSSYEELLDELSPDAVDAVIVALPNTMHEEAVERITDKKIPMLLEKPLGVTYQEAEAIAQAVRQSGTRCMIAMTGYFHPEFKAAYEALKSGEIGEVVSMQERIHFGNPTMSMNYVTKKHNGRGVGLENGIHTFERIECFSDSKISQIRGLVKSNGHLKGELEDYVAGHAVTQEGLEVPFSLQWTLHQEEDYVFRVTGTKGTIVVRGFQNAVLIKGDNEKVLYEHDLFLDMEKRHKPGFEIELKYFAKFLNGNKKEHLLEEALSAQRAVELLYRDEGE